MAKKTKSYSQVQATDALEQLGRQETTASEFIYDLLRIFAGYGDGQIRRTKEGPGNLAKDGETVLIKNLVAYRPFMSRPLFCLFAEYTGLFSGRNYLRTPFQPLH